MRTKGSLVPNPDHEIRKIRTRIWHVQNKNLTRFCCKEKIKIKQS
jgi:hypothetical protein